MDERQKNLTPVIGRRGRPRADVQCSPVSTRLPTPLHDKLIDMANQRQMSVSGLLRQIVIVRLRDL